MFKTHLWTLKQNNITGEIEKRILIEGTNGGILGI